MAETSPTSSQKFGWVIDKQISRCENPGSYLFPAPEMQEASMWKQNVLRNAIKFGNRLVRTEKSKRVPTPKRKLIVESLEVRAVLSSTPIVIDNSDSGFSKTGAWASASGGYAGNVNVSSVPNNGSEVASWTFVVAPGTYRVANTWHSSNSAHGSNVPFKIFDGTSLIMTVPVNQQIAPNDFVANSVWWENLGIFNVNSTLRIEISDSANGLAVADAMRVERVTAATDVAITNPSFEAQSLPLEGQTAPTITSWTPASSVSPATARPLNPSTVHTLGGTASHGSNAAWVYQNSIAQTLAHAILPDKEYRLSADLAFPVGTATSTWKVELLSGTTVLAWADERSQTILQGSFSTVEFSYVSTSVVPTQPLTIRLTSATGTTYFDNVRLTYTNARFAVPVGNDDVSYFTLPGVDLVVAPVSSLLSNDYSPEAVALTAVVVTQPTNGTLTSFSTNGTFTYRPSAGFTGIDTFTYKARAIAR